MGGFSSSDFPSVSSQYLVLQKKKKEVGPVMIINIKVVLHENKIQS